MRNTKLSNLEKKLVSKITPKILISFLENYLLLNGGQMKILELMTRLNLWLEDTLRIARYFLNNGLAAAVECSVVLKNQDKKIDYKTLRNYHWLIKWDINLRTQERFSESEVRLLNKFKNIVKDRPINNNLIDQYYNIPETNLKRMRLVNKEPTIKKKRICFFGDDDLTSLLFAMSNQFNEVVVYDIDKRIVNFINQQARALNLKKYRAFLQDYRQKFKGEPYDIFHSDPPATIEAVDLVLRRARELANPESSFYLSWPEFICDPEYLLELQKVYARNGWLVTAKFPEFNEYDNKCFFNYIDKEDWETLKLFNLTEKQILQAPPLQRYSLTRLLLTIKPGQQVGKWSKEIYLSNLHKIPSVGNSLI